jgi:hypothetical protein
LAPLPEPSLSVLPTFLHGRCWKSSDAPAPLTSTSARASAPASRIRMTQRALPRCSSGTATLVSETASLPASLDAPKRRDEAQQNYQDELNSSTEKSTVY